MLEAQESFTYQWWEKASAPPKRVQQLCQKLGLSSFLSEIMASKSKTIDEAVAFLAPKLQSHLPSPLLLPDIELAANIVANAIESGKKIALWGDYDVDGATSTALWHHFLAWANVSPRIYIPDRFKEGYGPNVKGMQKLAAEGVQLILTLDCGTTAFEPLAEAEKQGMDVIIIDHHASTNELPPARALVNPKRFDAPDAAKPMEILAAVGVSFFCLIALQKELAQRGFQKDQKPFDLRSLLDLVAIGTICDVVPLQGVNRLLVKQGLKVLNKRLKLGLNSLIADQSGPLNAKDVGFAIGPRLNAGSRLSQSNLAASLLSTSDTTKAENLSATLKALNFKRKAIQREVEDDARIQADQQKDKPFCLVHHTTWHEGVIGIVAGRLKELYNKPAFVISVTPEGLGKGSGRSIPGIDLSALIHQALAEKILLQGGGHAMAGGITLDMKNLERFWDFSLAFFDNTPPQKPESKLFQSTLTFQSLFLEELRCDLEQLATFGANNPSPLFLFQNLHIYQTRRLSGGHRQLFLEQMDGTKAKAILFSSKAKQLESFLDQPYRPFCHMIASLEWHHPTQKFSLVCEDLLPTSLNDTVHKEQSA